MVNIDAYEALSDENRAALEEFLRLCGAYLQDLFLLDSGLGTAVAQADRMEFLTGMQEAWDSGLLERAAAEIDRAQTYLVHNVGAQLLLADLWRLLRGGEKSA